MTVISRSAINVDLVGDLITVHAEGNPDKPAMVFDDIVTTYAELEEHACQVANGFKDCGIKRGARIAYLGKNTDSYYELMFGAAKAGVVLVAVNWRLTDSEVTYILNDAEVTLLFVEPEFQVIADKCISNCSGLKRYLLLNGEGQASYKQWRSSRSAIWEPMDLDPTDTCIQMYTSGTTGKPKGVELSHRCFFSQRKAELLAGEWGLWSEQDINLVAMPLFHIGGTGWGFVSFYFGSTNIIHATPEAEKIVSDISRWDISRMFLVPAVLQQVVNIAQKKDINLSSMNYVVHGASAIPELLLKDSIALFNCEFIQQYGMTEATGAVTYLPPEDHSVDGNARMQSCGKAFPGIELKICDETGAQLNKGETGEIYIKTPAIMTGYWQLEAATEEVLSDGWYKSGDAGYLDSDGYLFLQSRVKDMIVSGGENIYPAEIENVLYEYEKLSDAAIIGVPDGQWGEAVKAIVVKSAGKEVTEQDVIRFLRSRIAGYKLPKTVVFLTEIPRNASGKILKYKLREPYWKGYSRQIN